MSELARTARRQMREKARKLVDGGNGKVDASDYGPEEDLKAGVKTGLRPISRRQFRKGGKVMASEGAEAKKHAGRKPRKAGGSALIDDYVNRDVREANEKRDGTKHVGGFKKGGRAKREDGGEVPTQRFNFSPSTGSRMTQAAGLKNGGHPDEPQDRALIKKMVKAQDLTGRKDGGRAKRSTGGDLALGLVSPISLMAKKLLKKGGPALNGELQGTRPTGGREAHTKGGPIGHHAPREQRATGGRTKSGKTDINIIIGAKGDGAQQPPMGVAPMGPPPGGATPIPVPMPSASPPPMGGGALPPPPPSQAPPMGRKSGGRASYPMDSGAGSGEGRKEKLGWYGRPQDK